MTIALLNPVQTWSDSFVEDIPVSEEAFNYGTTSPEATDEYYEEVTESSWDDDTEGENDTVSETGEDGAEGNVDEAGQTVESSIPEVTEDGAENIDDASIDDLSTYDDTSSDLPDDSSTAPPDDSSTAPPDDSSADDSKPTVSPTVTPTVTPKVTGKVTPTVTPSASPTPTPKTKFTLTIYYVFPGGGHADSTYKETLKVGDKYSVQSPSVEGYVPDQAVINGTMKSSDASYTVTYEPVKNPEEFTLTIQYVDQNGNPIYDSYSGKYHYGDTYNVVSPSISGYTAQSASVAGTITGSVGFVVTYSINAQPVPTPSVTYTVRTPAQAYHAASYYTQKQVNPELAGFAKISKVYALAKCDSFLNVREGKSYSNRIVGVLYPNNLCFIIDDSDEKWTYIESGTVRGFVDKQYLLTGKKANQYVRKTGESKMTLAKQIIAPANNTAFRFALKTVRELPSSFNYRSATTTADRQAMIAFSEQFLGNPYVWGGESLTEGCDCSGFTMLIYRQFGIELPRCSYEQAEVGMKIPAMDALPGDLLFYARDGAVYHVLMYIGNGQAINASSSTTGIIISNVDYNKTCWGVRVIEDAAASSTQVSELVEIGQRAKDGDESAQQEIIQALVTASKDEWSQYGYLPSVLIAQVIEETNWLSFESETLGGIQPEDNNVLSMTEEITDQDWASPWTGETANRTIAQWDGKKDVYGEESVRTYEDMEACLADYAAYQTSLHPEIQNETDVEVVVGASIETEVVQPEYDTTITDIIDEYNLTQYDAIAQVGESPVDPTNYTQEELELIWAIVAQEDDTCYEGALAVISSAMNRADANYGGYGTTALEQLTADGQYCYSPKVSDPSLYQRRLGGNVPEFVIQAVSDCLTSGIRNCTYLNFRSSNRTGDYVQIGGNWYF